MYFAQTSLIEHTEALTDNNIETKTLHVSLFSLK
jgi:hypothetical protein